MVYTASTERRLLAYLIDATITCLCFIPVWMQIFASQLKDQMISVDLTWIWICLLLSLMYHWLFLDFLGGTIGKLIFGLRIVNARDPEKNLGLLQSLLRVLTDSLSFFFGQALRAIAFLRFDRTQVADWVAETRVVQFTPRKRLPVRRKILALLIALISGCHAIRSAYSLFQDARFSQGQITLPSESDARE